MMKLIFYIVRVFVVIKLWVWGLEYGEISLEITTTLLYNVIVFMHKKKLNKILLYSSGYNPMFL